MLLQEKSLRASSESNNCHVVSGSLKANTTGDFPPPPFKIFGIVSEKGPSEIQ